jgi:hypothetical protein
MATHRSSTRRTKGKSNQIVVGSWDDAWSRESSQATTIESMNADGWKTIRQASEAMGINASTIGSRVRNGYFDTIQKRALSGGCHRMVNFIRPKGPLKRDLV